VAFAHNLHECSQRSNDFRSTIKYFTGGLDGLKQNANAAMIDGGQAEKQRLSELFRYSCLSLTASTPVNGLRSAFEKIEKRSQELLAKGVVDLFNDEGADSREGARLIKQLGEAITHYQVSENQIVG
jgi:hypothetical protein